MAILGFPSRFMEASVPEPRRFVRQITSAADKPHPQSETVWKGLERYAGAGPLGVGRTQILLAYIDRQLTEQQGPLPKRRLARLRHVAVSYLEVLDKKVRSSQRT